MACWKQNCACKRNTVNVNGSDLNVTRTDDIPLTEKRNNPDIETENEDESRNLTWKKLSEIMDKVFYNIYMILIVISTLALFLVIIIGYNTADN